MSNSRSFRRQLVNILGPLDGARIHGGCNTCDAYQTVEPVEAGVWMIHIHHDGWCPTLARIKAHR